MKTSQRKSLGMEWPCRETEISLECFYVHVKELGCSDFSTFCSGIWTLKLPRSGQEEKAIATGLHYLSTLVTNSSGSQTAGMCDIHTLLLLEAIGDDIIASYFQVRSPAMRLQRWEGLGGCFPACEKHVLEQFLRYQAFNHPAMPQQIPSDVLGCCNAQFENNWLIGMIIYVRHQPMVIFLCYCPIENLSCEWTLWAAHM